VAEPLREHPALAAAAPTATGRAGVRCHERPGLCHTQIIARRGRRQAVAGVLGLDLPTRANAATTVGDIVILCLRPDDWLITTLDDEGRRGGIAVEARRRLQGLAAAIDQSHGRVVLRLEGQGARALLQHGCNLDLDAAVFPAGAMAQTGINGIAVLLHAVAAEQFDLHVARSFAAGLVRWLDHQGATLEPGRG
jgi:sarcosine oxidase subunit gamma